MDLQTRNQYMKAMGIPVWMPRVPPADEEQQDETYDVPPAPAQHISLEQRLAQTTDIPTAPPPAPVTEKTTESVIPVKIAPDCSQLNWSQLQQSVVDCQLCGLHKSRAQTVFGAGDTQSDWMIIGEAPGAEEDKQGQPFVGRAGKLLNNMLAAMGLPRNAVYISNVLKCRPPNNRDPKADEAALCRGYLERQIALVNPK
ncbi:MAG: Uracil-DNA glycosylase, family 4, partial [uncultured Thiotrichaceae bacterium]